MGTPKPETAFRTISEAAEEIGVPQHVLRFWETRFAQLQPLKRGGNRRYYRPADMDLLRTIRALLHDQGLTIRGAQLALANTPKAGSKPVAEPEATQPAMPTAPPSPSIDLAQLRAIRDRLRTALAA
jgi:DNA-binding transcriptional MerR regulator